MPPPDTSVARSTLRTHSRHVGPGDSGLLDVEPGSHLDLNSHLDRHPWGYRSDRGAARAEELHHPRPVRHRGVHVAPRCRWAAGRGLVPGDTGIGERPHPGQLQRGRLAATGTPSSDTRQLRGSDLPDGRVPGVPVASGRFPLVVFTHGYSGFRDQSTFLTTRLASWGFVVAASDLPDNDLTAVLSGMKSPGVTGDIAEQQKVITLMGDEAHASGTFHGHIDMSRVAAIGHSLGGAISEALAATDQRVTTFIGMAGATVGSFGQTTSGPTSMVPDKPGMLMVGTADQIASPTGIANAFTAMKAPKRLVTLDNFGHLVFSDICEIGLAKVACWRSPAKSTSRSPQPEDAGQ